MKPATHLVSFWDEAIRSRNHVAEQRCSVCSHPIGKGEIHLARRLAPGEEFHRIHAECLALMARSVDSR